MTTMTILTLLRIFLRRSLETGEIEEPKDCQAKKALCYLGIIEERRQSNYERALNLLDRAILDFENFREKPIF